MNREMTKEPSQSKAWSLADDEVTVLAAAATAKDALAASAAKGSPEPILDCVPDSLDRFVG